MRLGWPRDNARRALGAAGSIWIGVLIGLAGGWVAAIGVGGALVALAWRRAAIVALVVLAGVGAGHAAGHRIEATLASETPTGRLAIIGVAVNDAIAGPYGEQLVVAPVSIERGGRRYQWTGPRLVADVADDSARTVRAGDTVQVDGVLRGPGRLVRGEPVAGTIRNSAVAVLGPSPDPLWRLGNWARDRVTGSIGVAEPAGALLRGFLIGDVRNLPERDLEMLRRSGLAHFVAVSGGNVALYLAAWWVVLRAVGVGSRVRALVGLGALAIFVVMTRWEPSVVRAGTMAGVLLAGRLVGMAVAPWTAFGVAVTVLLAISPELAIDVGFQLSAAATAGLLLGAPLIAGRRPRWVWAVLGATMAAQLAVLPLLLVHFGTTPAAAPLANLAGAPLVTVATALGGIGALLGVDPAIDAAVWCAGAVLAVARTAAELPQLDVWGVGLAAAVVALGSLPRLRPAILVAVSVVLVASSLPATPPTVPMVTVLDVGQGDAVLVRGPSGFVALVDGGRDPLVLADALRRSGVRRLDLVVVTHGDADHVGGLASLIGSIPVAALWVPDYMRPGPLLENLLAEADTHGVPTFVRSAGADLRVGSLSLELLGPRRRYAGDNDGSIVLLVSGRSSSMLLAGDVEAIAQQELPAVRPDVLLVPHHGSATTDLDWLADTVGSRAIISVGSNDYGHPAPGVLRTLVDLGVEVATTQDHGDISVELP